MEQIFIIILITVVLLAILDIMVGVSNDAVNFLNSAIGSKAASFRTIMIIASCGLLFGAIFSSGMMEIARSGIFVPSMFSFYDLMIIMLTVMIADVILLDLFNYIGFPTSTTVSIIFELLGAATCLAFIKVLNSDQALYTVLDYINTEKASEIVVSIVLSVFLSFIVGSFVQYVTRFIFTFNSEARIKRYGGILGGVAITAISFFILIKGAKNLTFISDNAKDWIAHNQLLLIGINFVFWTIVSQILIILKINILRIIILIGTFALALAFAGNDLVNFIGVPIAALQSYDIFQASGVTDPHTFMMGDLANSDIVAPVYYLIIAGVIMIITLWTSKKAKNVIQTELSLSKQDEGTEKFNPNFLSRAIVRAVILLGNVVDKILPKSFQLRVEKRFEKPQKQKTLQIETTDEEAFDMIRASVNLLVASILISIGTSLKLPLSTTYVTFMVAMGTSFADRAWDRDSAVFRVAGVFNVIGGWFLTGISAFMIAAIISLTMYYGGTVGVIGMIIVLGIILFRSHKSYEDKSKVKEEVLVSFTGEDIDSVQKILAKNKKQIGKALSKIADNFALSVKGIDQENLGFLNENKKKIKKLITSIEDLKINFYRILRNMDQSNINSSKIFVQSFGYIQNIIISINFINTSIHTYIYNNHRQLKPEQIGDLKTINTAYKKMMYYISKRFLEDDLNNLGGIEPLRKDFDEALNIAISNQIARIQCDNISQKSSTLYFTILTEIEYSADRVEKLVRLYKGIDQQIND
ncbi:inorganic phosphate transporter [Weeksella virosa]|uniref:Phosphate transporter n=1 Tax=Weeksella virosa (strain ATCC 43766 / DSM 16922 / JCM 21250 / CCUG 30538 / CDC 9751 / IAM 14551 / NBRC 16016 / NCTC 11634 / CL345/78) TaxID=865938 RepID=F0NY01_WEEVC|nr:inorganic phosphate transporter [Weeksella virosa]ADX68069.1 phosphate transporter [Weeksella virosa DSM 16922]VEH64296.1 Phosphate transporter family [Weeksella virosa]